MFKLLPIVVLTIATLNNVLCSDDKFDPDFFAFQNGVHFRSTEDRIKVLKELGFDGIGSANLNNLKQRSAKYAENNLKIYSIYAGVQITKEGYSIPKNLPGAIEQLKGTQTVVELFVGGKGTDDQAVKAVGEIAALAKDSGLKVVLYPHSGCHVEKIADAVRIAKKVDQKNVGVMFNLCHFLMVEPESNLVDELKKAKPYLWRVSICGAEVGTRSWKTLIQPLDQGNFDQEKLFRILQKLNFKGAIGLQCYAVPGDSKTNLQKSIRRWNELIRNLKNK